MATQVVIVQQSLALELLDGSSRVRVRRGMGLPV